MTIITLRNLGIILGKPLFSSLSLTVNAGDRIGIVAANGCGKSTLLHCLSGDMEPTSGDITRLRGLTQSIVHQHLPAPLMERTMRDAVLSALPADTVDSESWRADIIFDAMLVPEPFRERRLKELSGGWQRLAMLARAWISEPDVLLLDEPTNHLDLEKINVLENWSVNCRAIRLSSSSAMIAPFSTMSPGARCFCGRKIRRCSGWPMATHGRCWKKRMPPMSDVSSAT